MTERDAAVMRDALAAVRWLRALGFPGPTYDLESPYTGRRRCEEWMA